LPSLILDENGRKDTKLHPYEIICSLNQKKMNLNGDELLKRNKKRKPKNFKNHMLKQKKEIGPKCRSYEKLYGLPERGRLVIVEI